MKDAFNAKMLYCTLKLTYYKLQYDVYLKIITEQKTDTEILLRLFLCGSKIWIRDDFAMQLNETWL